LHGVPHEPGGSSDIAGRRLNSHTNDSGAKGSEWDISLRYEAEMIFASGLSVPEGPVALGDGSWLVVEGGPGRGCITQISPDGLTSRIVARTGEPNGLAVDRNGVIWAAELRPPSLLRVTLNGTVEVIATGCEGEPFLFPNDLCFGPDGGLYLTDSGFLMSDFAPGGQIRSDYMNLEMNGRLYRVDPKDRSIRKLDSGLGCANGLAFGPANDLYVAETRSGAIYRYAWKDGGRIARKEEFANVLNPDARPGWKGPDGMAFGADGKLYIAVFGQQEVVVLKPDGSVDQHIQTQGAEPTNLAFGLSGQKKIYVTECEFGQLEIFDVSTDGLPLWT
jgi:gluconolactonase